MPRYWLAGWLSGRAICFRLIHCDLSSRYQCDQRSDAGGRADGSLALMARMNRLEFQSLATERLDDAAALLKAGRYAGAYYISFLVTQSSAPSKHASRERQSRMSSLQRRRQSITCTTSRSYWISPVLGRRLHRKLDRTLRSEQIGLL